MGFEPHAISWCKVKEQLVMTIKNMCWVALRLYFPFLKLNLVNLNQIQNIMKTVHKKTKKIMTS